MAINLKLRAASLFCALLGTTLSIGVQAATVNVIPAAGFSDATAAAPVGGNNGTTVGQQRLIAFQFAANIWGARLASSVPINVNAQFSALSCTASGAILGSAGPANGFRDFPGAPVSGTFYASALANSLAGSDLDPSAADINANFNSNLGQANCLSGSGFYYGLDSKPSGNLIDFVAVLVHEMGHGLGFLTFVDLASGAKANGFNDAFMLNLENHGATPPDYPSMTNAQRVAASTANGNLHWTGANVQAASALLTAGKVGTHVRMYAPTTAQPGSSVSHWDTVLTPDQIMEPSYTSALHSPIMERQAFRDISWKVIPQRLDFTGEGGTDILFRNSGGDIVLSKTQGATIASSTFITNVPPSYTIAGSGDFNSDGKTDLLYRNSNGDLVISFFNTDGKISSTAYVGNVAAAYSVVGVGDFNGDGFADIMFRNTSTGDIVILLMNGSSVIGGASIGTVPLNYAVAGVGDFNADGKADILFRDPSSGANVIFLMNGFSIASAAVTSAVPPRFYAAAIADFNGDGRADILWRDQSTGDNVVSLVSGTSIVSSTAIAAVPPNWIVAQAGDVNSDGKADIFFRNTSTGDIVLALMNGPSIASTVGIGNVPTAFVIQASNAN